MSLQAGPSAREIDRASIGEGGGGAAPGDTFTLPVAAPWGAGSMAPLDSFPAASQLSAPTGSHAVFCGGSPSGAAASGLRSPSGTTATLLGLDRICPPRGRPEITRIRG